MYLEYKEEFPFVMIFLFFCVLFGVHTERGKITLEKKRKKIHEQ